MNTGKTLFAQIMDFLPWKTFLSELQHPHRISFDWRRLGHRSRDLGQVFKQRRGTHRKPPVKQ